ncbi:type IV toxin-antitoxin system AbiEi family antitoxin domain-containing protein [Conexibacter sp. DBS9H8]|uniref:type IV toxin-antitoxin system AbiEi family antitoxin domain-containing protein n=1 Tax=Conexibacter sp. DBS9H8 TaxID=2937801 RepID=UPI003530F6A9
MQSSPRPPAGSRSGAYSAPNPARAVVTLGNCTVWVVPGARERVRNALAIAEHQRGLVSTAQLLAAGWTASATRSATGTGRLIRIRRGVHRSGGSAAAPTSSSTASRTSFPPTCGPSSVCR